MNKEVVVHMYIHAHNRILFSHKKKILLFLTTWMELEGINLSAMSDTERQILHIWILCRESKKSWTQWNRIEWVPWVALWEKWGAARQRVQTHSLKTSKSGGLMYIIVIIDNIVVFYSWKFLREYTLNVFITGKHVIIMWHDGSVS